MADITDLPVALRFHVANLFRAQNYCFATTTINRSPTFYFTTGGLNALNAGRPNGRLRTMHPHGPVMEFTTASKGHCFYAPFVGQGGPRDQAHNQLGAIQNQAALTAFEQNQQRVPQAGQEHLEYTRRPRVRANGQVRFVTSRHRSGGLVTMNPRVFTDADCVKILNDVLSQGRHLKIDGVSYFLNVPAAAPPAHVHPTIAGYIASL